MMTTITKNALIKRINRKLAHEGEVLRTARSPSDYYCHPYYVVDMRRNAIEHGVRDLEELGRQLEVLREGDVVDL